jgi:hypothetical protein
VGTDEGEERLGSLLNGLVEGLGGGVSVGAEDLVLGKEHSLCVQHVVSRHRREGGGGDARIPPMRTPRSP